MVSNTKATENRRAAKTVKAGKAGKKARAKASTPKFPVHVEAKKASK